MGGSKKSFEEMRWENKIADILVCHNQRCRACWDLAGLIVELINLYLRRSGIKITKKNLGDLILMTIENTEVECTDTKQSAIEISALIKDL